MAGSMREEDVVDGGAPGTGGNSRGGSNRRRRSPGTGGSDRQIGADPASIGCVAWSWRSRDGMRSWWWAWFGPGSSLFIEGEGAAGQGWGRPWHGDSGELES
jgi:hypothetical protein